MLSCGLPTFLAAASTSWRFALRGLLFSAAAAWALPAQPQRRVSAAAEDYSATWWNITNGLPQSSINAIVQHESGELWIATHGGLLGFDGLEFRRFDLDRLPRLRSNRITALVADDADGLWFTTQEGALHHLRRECIDQSLQVPGAAGSIALLRARDGSLWVQSTDGAVQRYDSGYWTEVLAASGTGRYRGLCSLPDGTVCAVARNEVVLFEPSGSERTRMTAPSEVLSLATDEAEGLWVGLDDGIARMHGGEIARYRVEPAIEAPVHVILDDERGALWLGTSRGALHVAKRPGDEREIHVRSSADIAGGFEVRSLILDRDGNLWLGGSEAGLLRFSPSRVVIHQGIPGRSAVTALCDDGAGGAWVGFANRGLVRFPASGDESVDVMLREPGPELPVVHSLLHDRRGRTWVGVDDRWVRRDSGQFDEFLPVLPETRWPPAVGPLAELPDGDVWLSTPTGKLLRLGPEDDVLEELDLQTTIQTLAAARDGSLWVGGNDEVLHVDRGEITRYAAESGLPPGSVRDLLPAADGSVWIASYGGGLARLAGGRVQRISSAQGLFDSSLSRLLFDGQDRLWILSNLGLMVAARAELEQVFSGARARFDPIVIGPESGLNEASAGSPAGFRDEEGRLWFGTIAGPVRVDAEEFPFNAAEPSVRIQRVRAEDATLLPADSLDVPPGTRRLQFDYTAFALSAPQRVHFRYRLDGYDDQWIEAGGARQASYTALSPGAYTFRVAARNEDGVWSSKPEALRVRILPAWWETAYFRGAVVLAALGLLLALHRLRVQIVTRRTQALLEATQGRARAEERSSRLREELAHVARVATAGELATSLAHEVNQPLAAIVTNAEAARRFLARDGMSSADLDAILRDIAQQGERASEVIRRLRKFLRKHESERTPVDLNDLVHATLPLLRRELEDHSAVVDLDLAEDLPSVGADPVQIQQVIVNLVKNACDALSSHPGERRIRLRTRRAANGAALEVEDSGPGIAADVRERVFQPYVTTKPAGMGLGLAICRTIVEAHGGRLVLVGTSAAGAAFRVDLPGESGRKDPS